MARAVFQLSPESCPALMALGIVLESMVGSDHAAVLVYAHPFDHSGRTAAYEPV